MKQKSLLKYKIGFTILGIFTVVFLFMVISQAQATKDDSNTYNSASTISDTLNQYIIDSGVVPISLNSAGVHSVPSTISYQKLSDISFKFCVYYKTTSSGFDPSATVTNLLTSSLSSNQTSPTDNTYLYVDPTHHKGNNCQKINPSYLNSNTQTLTTF